MSSPSALGGIPVQSDPDASVIAGQMMAYVQTYAQDLNNLVGSLVPPIVNPVFPVTAAPPQQNVVKEPTIQDVVWSVPTAPAPFTQTVDVSQFIPGPFTGIAPTLNFGAQPQTFAGTIPPSPGIDYNYVYPVVDVSFPDVPPLLSIENLTFDPVIIPTFGTAVPAFTLVAPSLIAYVEKAFYTSTELTTVQAEINSALTDDTDIGLSASVQQAMWDAAREREYRQMADAQAALDRDIEVLGFALPPGVYIDARLKIQTEFGYTVAGVSREIMVKQAELRLENVTKARELAVTLETSLIGYYNNICQRQFEAAKYVTDAQVAIYNAGVQSYQAQVEGYKASIEAFNASIRALELYIEQLKAEIAFQQTKADINTSIVNQYKAQVDATQSQLDVYKIQVDIIQTQAQVEKLKVDTYGAQIQAFVGTVNAYTAEVEGYKALIEAQTAIESAYKTSVDAYSAEVQAGVAAANATVAGFEAQVKAYEAQLDSYKAALQAMVEQARAASEFNQSTIAEYTAKTQAVTAFNQTLTNQWESIVKVQEEVTEIAVKTAEANGQLYIATKNLAVEASKAGIQSAAQLGAAALNAVHYSNNSNWSFSESDIASISDATSISTNTNFNSSV